MHARFRLGTLDRQAVEWGFAASAERIPMSFPRGTPRAFPAVAR